MIAATDFFSLENQGTLDMTDSHSIDQYSNKMINAPKAVLLSSSGILRPPQRHNLGRKLANELIYHPTAFRAHCQSDIRFQGYGGLSKVPE